ncbi:N-acetylmuramoyl-L-alanine amidase [Bacillus sp. B-jedd]|uniref:N-acetylmuramoyl-L-alanine amidase n=1 Tax=Bacillus sp. B-jedd TaxID=1476857 RepID=UPI00051561A2|nr:N-acetylmuramoyl-L-alanine amidase [Bacillus sp. B-jedd]CEG29099.1 N-acetylmuramoyl-L-alanine amidase [Bacillus sp. B-jedd]
MKVSRLAKILVSFVVLFSFFFTLGQNNAEAAYSFQAKVTASSLNVRSGGSTAYQVVGSLKSGQVVTVLEQKNGWSMVSSGTLKGWVSTQYLAAVTWTGYVTASSLNVRQSASATSAVVGAIPKGTSVTVQGADGSWLKVTVPSKNLSGWVSSSYIAKTAPAVVYPKVVLKANTSLRKGPGTTYAIISSETAGTYYDKISQKDGWIQVKKANGVTGWITATLLVDPAAVLKGKVIVLDAGHGGYDSGAVGAVYYEKTLTLRTALQLGSVLQKAGARVIYTRSTDVYLTLGNRVTLSNQNLADAFVSIHYNALNRTSSGIMTFYYNSAKDYALASSMQNAIIAKTKMKNLGTKYGNYHVLRENKRPAALLELGFISNPYEEKIVSTATFQNNAVQGAYDGLFNYFLRR